MKKIIYFLLAIGTLNVVAQNSTITPQGTGFPNISLSTTSDVSKTPSPLVSQLIYNTNGGITGAGAEGAGYYFWNGTVWKKLAIAPVSGGGGSLPTTGIVLSETETNTPLANAGFSLLGKASLGYSAYVPGNPVYEWSNATTTSGAPSERIWHSTALVNSKMMVWGGMYNNTSFYNNGALFDLSANTWTTISNTNAPTTRGLHSAVSTGTKVIIWGGLLQTMGGNTYRNNGGIYDATTDTWATISATNAPVGRHSHTAIWTGTKMIVWGGTIDAGGGSTYTNTGGIYDPVADSWVATNTTNAPSARFGHSAVWTGSKMIIWGGFDIGGNAVNTGAIYDPTADTWAAITTSGAPSVRMSHLAIWANTKMFIIGGAQYSSSTYRSDSFSYDPIANTWSSASIGGSGPDLKGDYIGNNKIMVLNGTSYQNMNAPMYANIYNISTNSSLNLPTNQSTPTALERRNFSFVWNGQKAVVWGGKQDYGTYTLTGALISPTNYQVETTSPFYLFKKD